MSAQAAQQANTLLAQVKTLEDEESWMLDKVTARLRKFLRKTSEGHSLHAPFRVTTHRGHSACPLQRAAGSSRPSHLLTEPTCGR